MLMAHRSATTNGNGNTKPVGEAGQNAGAVAGTPKLPNTPKLQSESPELRQSTELIAKISRPCILAVGQRQARPLLLRIFDADPLHNVWLSPEL
jgi:hypothetical protein